MQSECRTKKKRKFFVFYAETQPNFAAPASVVVCVALTTQHTGLAAKKATDTDAGGLVGTIGIEPMTSAM